MSSGGLCPFFFPFYGLPLSRFKLFSPFPMAYDLILFSPLCYALCIPFYSGYSHDCTSVSVPFCYFTALLDKFFRCIVWQFFSQTWFPDLRLRFLSSVVFCFVSFFFFPPLTPPDCFVVLRFLGLMALPQVSFLIDISSSRSFLFFCGSLFFFCC